MRKNVTLILILLSLALTCFNRHAITTLQAVTARVGSIVAAGVAAVTTRITEEGDRRITEEGDVRITED